MMNIELDLRGPVVGKPDSVETPVVRTAVRVEKG